MTDFHRNPFSNFRLVVFREQGNYQEAQGHISGPKACSEKASHLTVMKGRIAEFFRGTLHKVLSLECQRSTEFPSKASNVEVLMSLLVDQQCSQFKTSTRQSEVLEDLRHGVDLILHRHHLDESRALPGKRQWLPDHLAEFTQDNI